MAVLFIMSGPSGSGKSTWARDWINSHPNTCIVSTDKIREHLYGDASIQDCPQLVFNVAYKQANTFLRNGYDVIFDATSLTSKDRKRVKSRIFAEKYICIAMNTSLDECLTSQKLRERQVPNKVVTKQFNKYELPNKEKESLNDVWIVNR